MAKLSKRRADSKENPNIAATHVFTKHDDGLRFDWCGRIYMNPPYGREIGRRVEKLAHEYGEGHTNEAIALGIPFEIISCS